MSESSLLEKRLPVKEYLIILAVTLVIGLPMSFEAGAIFGDTGEYERGWQHGYDNGTADAYGSLERSDVSLVFRRESGLNRSIGVSFKDQDLSFGCFFTGHEQVQISELTWEYDNGTKCRFFQGDITERWDNPNFNNTEVEVRNATESQ